MIKKVILITWWKSSHIKHYNLAKSEEELQKWNIKSNIYWFLLDKELWKLVWSNNVENLRVAIQWEYRGDILQYIGYNNNLIKLWKYLLQNNNDSTVFIFHWVQLNWLIFSLFPLKHKAWRRHCTVWTYKNASSKFKWFALCIFQIFFQLFMHTIFYVNDYEKKELKKFWYRGNKHFLPIPIDTDFWSKDFSIEEKEILYKSYNKMPNEVWLFLSGSVQKRKNQLSVIKALSLIPLYNKKIVLHCVGPILDADYHKSCLESAKEGNVNVVFHWEKTANFIREFVSIVDIVIQPSFQEWQCQSIMESALQKKTIIASNIETFTDTFKDWITYFDPSNIDNIAASISYIIDEFKHWKTVSTISQNFDLIQKWSIKSFKKQVEDFIFTVK